MKAAETLPMPEGYPVSDFDPAAWSPDGRWIAAIEGQGAGTAGSFAVYDLEDQSLRRLDLDTEGRRLRVAGWLPAGCRTRGAWYCKTERT